MKKSAETPLYRWINENGIRGLLFDFDDTLIQTQELFEVGVARIIELFSTVAPHVAVEEIARILAEVGAEAYKERAVNPNRWELTIPMMEEKLAVEQSVAEQALALASAIYKEKPQFEPGAEVILQTLKEWGMLLGLVTHANVEWTLFKLQSLGLENFFDTVQIIGENKQHKKPEDWIKSAEKIQLPPREILVAGDSIGSDIKPAHAAGFPHIAWINKLNGWSRNRVGTLPQAVMTVDTIKNLLQLGS